MPIQQSDPVGFVITLRDVYTELQAHNGKLGEVSGQLIAMQVWQDGASKTQVSLGGRVAALERANARVYGALALLSALFAGGGAWVAVLVIHR